MEPTAPPPTAYVHGTVTDGFTGAALAGAFVVTHPWSFYATTNATGYYAILVGLASWPATVNVTASDALHRPQSQSVTLNPNSNVTLNFTLVPYGGWIAGLVTNDSLAPIAGCVLVFRDAQGAMTVDATDATGRFNESLPPGTYDVNASAQGYVSTHRPGVVVVSNTTAHLSLQLNALNLIGWLAGTISGSGYAIANATIRVFSGNLQVALVRTDASGRYNISLPVGMYAVNASANGFGSSNATGLSVTMGVTTQHDVALTALPPPPPAPPPYWLVASVIAVIALGAIVAVLLLRRAHRRP